jgi:hypothetical protein
VAENSTLPRGAIGSEPSFVPRSTTADTVQVRDSIRDVGGRGRERGVDRRLL